ncbi:MAG TPA: two-component sensor histidine kinase, partial [Ruminococcaceae bacterium]|nr:two-component sensor histidine kinase [Oscillospiraceae bacterium]
YRVDKSRSKQVGGTGLGLSIVKHSATRIGAEIEVESVLNGGTAVIVRLPKERRRER